MSSNDSKCKCEDCVGIHTIVNRPGDSEAIVECKDCGQLWDILIYERMFFSEGSDVFEVHQIPITTAEYQKIKEITYEDLDLTFLQGRKARVISDKNTIELDSNLSLARCGK